jgi:hypothetical protein
VKGLSDVAWETPGPVWSLFKRAFAAVELPYFTPHSFRRTLAQAVLRAAQDPEMIKILSQNLGHEGTLVTLTSRFRPKSQLAERATSCSAEIVSAPNRIASPLDSTPLTEVRGIDAPPRCPLNDCSARKAAARCVDGDADKWTFVQGPEGGSARLGRSLAWRLRRSCRRESSPRPCCAVGSSPSTGCGR